MKHHAPHLEFTFASQAFNLEVQETTDGERLTRENRESEDARRVAETRQAFMGELGREQGMTFDGEPSYELSDQDLREIEAENRHRAHFKD